MIDPKEGTFKISERPFHRAPWSYRVEGNTLVVLCAAGNAKGKPGQVLASMELPVEACLSESLSCAGRTAALIKNAPLLFKALESAVVDLEVLGALIRDKDFRKALDKSLDGYCALLEYIGAGRAAPEEAKAEEEAEEKA